jgi:hypothetical protein
MRTLKLDAEKLTAAALTMDETVLTQDAIELLLLLMPTKEESEKLLG